MALFCLVFIATIVPLLSLNDTNNTNSTAFMSMPPSIAPTPSTSFSSTSSPTTAEKSIMEQFETYTIKPPFLWITIGVLLGIICATTICCVMIYKHRQLTKEARRNLEKSVPPEPFELQLTIPGNSMGKKSKKHVTIVPTLTPDNSTKRLKELHTNTMDTPSPMDYDIDHEMDFGKRVEFEKAKSGSFSAKTNRSNKSNKSNASSSYTTSKGSKGSNPGRNRLRFQKVKSNDPSEMDQRPNSAHTYGHGYNVSGATTATLQTMVIHSHNSGHSGHSGHTHNDPQDDDEESEQLYTKQDEDTDDGTDTGTPETDIGDDETEREDTGDLLAVKKTEMKSGYMSGTGTMGMGSEYEYDNEWYEPTLTDQGRPSGILKQCDSDREISTTEDMRKQIAIKLQNKDRKQLRKLSQALEIIKDDLGIETSMENPSHDDTHLYDPSHEYPISEYDLNSDAFSNKYSMRSGKSGPNAPNINKSNNQTIMGILDQDEKINEKTKGKLGNSPRHDMVIKGSDDEMETNTAMKQSELSHSMHQNDNQTESDNDEEQDYDNDNQYYW
eukprot:CAMPEP_0201577720 /NCGR_PEP_ID=MMETSP0190_2-20130828/24202_1 /ASSEMBLY_ACC=CAM_ASM_000263 /TAXON_ID=37353 /ORGANISM="Rosalina sp." /LENGTH=553 /DNA_ID=CAMNT_0048010035 /DNA_START=12 /DNA_END=1670 /DNA_ORIENTATION=+